MLNDVDNPFVAKRRFVGIQARIAPCSPNRININGLAAEVCASDLG